jgi:hypothetical protein
MFGFIDQKMKLWALASWQLACRVARYIRLNTYLLSAVGQARRLDSAHATVVHST